MNVKVIYEDSQMLVLDKPSGVIVNKSDTAKEDTIQVFLEEKNKQAIQNATDDEFKQRAGIVHRLDKETSGILLTAKTQEAFQNLKNQFKNRETKKTYIALSHGITPEQGEISVPVGRLPWNRKRFGVLAGGREAKTYYEKLRNLEISGKPFSLLKLSPKTGRTHQIRVHLKYIGFPIFGDELYAGRKTAREDRKILPRLFLHASEISFKDPLSGSEITLKSELPGDLASLII